MPKFRKKPVVIEAVLWNGREITDPPPWIGEAIKKNPHEPGCIFRIGDKIDIFTLEGVVTASPGDWIIRGTNGELYPCKPDIFAAIYDPVNDQQRGDGDYPS